MTFQAARNNEIDKLKEAIASYYAQGIDPPHYLTRQLSDLEPYGNSSSCGNPNTGGGSTSGQLNIRYHFAEFASTWNISTPTISYPQVAITVTEMQGYVLVAPLHNVVPEVESLPQGAIIKFFAAGQPVAVKGYAIAV